jgi:hypothetical protein
MSVPLLAAIQILSATQAAPPSVVGVVRDGGTGVPLAGAVVVLTDLDRDTITTADGRYLLSDVPSGPQHLLIRFMGYTPRTLQVLVPSDGELEINIALDPEPVRLPVIEVRVPVATGGMRPGGTGDSPDPAVSAAAMWTSPLLAEPDAFQALAGSQVSIEPESPDGIHVRGSASDQTAYMLDGVPIFNPYHAAGLFSAWNPDALSQLSLEGANPAPDYPATLSGTVSGWTRSPGPRLETRGSTTTTQARVTLDGPLGRTGIGFLLSVRSGLPMLVAPNDPTYLGASTHDWLGKVLMPALGGGLRLLGYSNQNAIDAAASASQPGVGRNLFRWKSRSFGAEWQRTFSRTNLRLQAWSAEGTAGSAWNARIGPVELSNHRHDLGLLAEVDRPRAGGNSLLGMRLERIHTSYQLQSDSDQPIYSPSATTPVVTLFGEEQVAFGSRAMLEVGASLAASTGGPRLGPRAEIRWSPVSRLTLTGSYIRAHQFAQSLRNPESVVGNVFPADLYLGAGTAGVPVAQSDQGVLALDYRPAPGVKLRAQAYARRETGLLLIAPSDGEPFTTGSFTVGSGESQGLSLDAAVTSSRFGIVASYALQRVRLSYNGASYIPDLAATHQLQGGVTFLPIHSLSLRLGGTALFGRRTTTIASGFEWEACNLTDRGCEFAGSPYYGGEPLGAVQLPTYLRADFSARQHWSFTMGGRQVEMAVFGTFTNLFGRTNVLTYARDPSTGRPVAVEMRPRSPLVLGLDWRF